MHQNRKHRGFGVRHQSGPTLRVEWRDDEDVSRSVWVFGEVDIATVGELRKALKCDQPRLVVDLSNVAFMDLSGLQCLLEAAEKHDAVELITSPRVDRLLEITSTDHVFQTE